MTPRDIDHQSRGEVEQMRDELIGMLRLDSERPKDISGEVTHVPGDNHVRAPPNGGGQHMPIVRIRQMQTLNQGFVAGNERILCMFVHEHPGPLQLLARQIRPIAQESGHPFLVHAGGPLRAEQPCQGQVHQ